ncbi:50S ribosomal protein L13 [Candidatus Pacearchaeota archaeon]|nr:50S ribosomal protein L13 [Candidatus Pacearchaeota archaeon]
MVRVYFDANGAVLGRVGSLACKELLKGKEVTIINAEKAIITGSRENIIGDISAWKGLGGKGLKGPKVPRTSDRLMKRMIRGMLPWDRTKGREAFDRLRCFIGNGPLTVEELRQVQKVEVKKPLKSITVAEVSKYI